MLLFLTAHLHPQLFLYYTLRGPEEPVSLFAAVEGTGDDIYTSGYQWVPQLWVQYVSKRLEEKTVLTHLHPMPFHSFSKYFSKAFCVQSIQTAPGIA